MRKYLAGVAGALLIVAAVVVLAGPWWGVGVAGVFLLALDRRVG